MLTSRSVLTLIGAAVALSTCSPPEYQSGRTVCAKSAPFCPDGFVCGPGGANEVRRCYLPSEVPAGPAAGGSSGSGPLGTTGGASGTGGPIQGGRGGTPMPGTGGRGGSSGTGGSSIGGASGSGGSNASFPPAPACASVMADNVCDQCEYSLCCNEFQGCVSNQGCVAFVRCLTACPDGDRTCQQTCVMSNQAGAQLFISYVDCSNMKCAQPCNSGMAPPMPPPMPPPGTGGTGGGGMFPPGAMCVGAPAADDCDRCNNSRCCAETAACFGPSRNPACVMFFQCFGACNRDMACQDRCISSNMVGFNLALANVQCEMMKCTPPCEADREGPNRSAELRRYVPPQSETCSGGASALTCGTQTPPEMMNTILQMRSQLRRLMPLSRPGAR
jgi:hypothetical protein